MFRSTCVAFAVFAAMTVLTGHARGAPDYWDTRLDQICGLYLEDVSDSVSTGSYYWRLVRAEFEDESESGFNHHIYYKCLDAEGDPIENQKTWGSWWYTNETGSASQFTKGAIDGYWANFAMYANCPGPPENPCGWPYNAWVDTASGPSDKVWGMGMTDPNGTGCGAHVNYRFTWQWTQKTAGGEPPEISVTPSSLNPETDEGSSPASESFTVQNTGGGTLDYTISDDATWLSVSPSTGTSTGESDTISVTYSTASLSPGSYNATLTVSDQNASNTPQTVSVSLTVNSVSQPTILLDPTALSRSTTEGSSPANQTFTVTNSGSGTLNYSIVDDAAWLDVSPTNGTSTGELDTMTVSYSTASLTAGTYNATITVSDGNASNNPQTIDVSLTVTAASFDGLDNTDFEGGAHDDPDGDHRSGNSWTRFSLAGASKAGVPWIGSNAHSPNYVQEIYEGSWTAGIYQQASGATSGNTYEASVYVWGSSTDVKFWIGIDPTGGTDAASGNVVWSSQSAPGSTWTQISVQADAGGATVTVFLKAQNTRPWNLYARFDDADLTDEGPGGPPATGTISGTVTDSLSNPISGATIETDTGGYATTTDSSGDYVLSDVAVGTYDVTAMKSGYVSETVTDASVQENQTTDVDFSLDAAPSTGSISGFVKDTSNQAIVGATVETDTGGYSTTTDGNGAYTLSDVSPGTYDVTASKTGYVSQTQQDVAVTAGQTTTLNFNLSEPAPFDGLDNGDMEGGSFDDPDGDHKSPNDWTRFSLSGFSKTAVPWLGGGAHSPNYVYEVYEANWIAGIYQQVTGTTGGNDYTASVWVRGDADIRFWIGVDPSGGTDANSADVAWSSQSVPGGTWTQISKQVTANGSTITVFLEAQNPTGLNQYARFDDAQVTSP